MGRRLRTAAVGVTCLALGACGLPLSGLGAAGADGGADLDGTVVEGGSPDVDTKADVAAPAEGGGEADVASPEAGDAGASPIASVGSVANATGLSSQGHLVYANHDAAWWLFWIDTSQPQAIRTSRSTDFATWSEGPSLPLAPLSHGGQGGNYSVAYADLGGTDVVHLSIGASDAQGKRHHLHDRATIAGGSIVFAAVDDLSDVQDPLLTDPDGPATFVDPQGFVWDATGWAQFNGTGNEVAWQSTNSDVGTAWVGGFGAQQNVFQALLTIHSRAFATAGTAPAALVALWDQADLAPPTNVGWTRLGPGQTPAPATVFDTAAAMDANDWGVATMTNGHMHVARRATSGDWSHVRYDGNAWTTLAAPPTDSLPAATGSGVVVLAEGTNCAIVTIAGDAASSVRMINWNGTAWGAWMTIEGTPAPRAFLSGWSGPKTDAVVWTEGSGANHVVRGQVVAY